MSETTFLAIVVIWLSVVMLLTSPWGAVTHLAFGALCSWYGYARRRSQEEVGEWMKGQQ